jgi:clan AA aspartic protease
MIVGSVDPNGDAVVPIRVRGSEAESSRSIELPVVVDTGFNEWLTLPPDMITALSLRFREEGRYTLADGSEAASRLFAAEVEWFGRWRRVLIAEMDGGPLMGMALLSGSYLGIEVTSGGRVQIQALDR